MTTLERRWNNQVKQGARNSASSSVLSSIATKSSSRQLLPPLSKLPTSILLRSIMLTSIMSSSMLLRPCLALMSKVTSSASPLFDLEWNPILRRVLRRTVYDHFCAGTNPEEVKQTVGDVKDMGFRGVILGYGQEIVLGDDPHAQHSVAEQEKRRFQVVEEWKKGTLETLAMIGPGDILAIKWVLSLLD